MPSIGLHVSAGDTKEAVHGPWCSVLDNTRGGCAVGEWDSDWQARAERWLLRTMKIFHFCQMTALAQAIF